MIRLDLRKWVAWPVRSSEIKEDGLRFIERQRGDHNPFKVAGFESKEWLRSSEIKEDGLRFALRGSEERQPLQSRWFWGQRTAT